MSTYDPLSARFHIPQKNNPVIDRTYKQSSYIAKNKGVYGSNKASEKSNRVPEKKVAKQAEVWANDFATLKNKPIGCDENTERRNYADDEAENVPI